MEGLTQKAARLLEIDVQMSRLKEERTRLESAFAAAAEKDLRDTKRKMACYYGGGAKVTATMADTVKLIYPALLS